jgi:inosine-uridine nucleoside N-ribohydrolase
MTTVAENGGRRAGYARYILALEGKNKVPVAAGADNSGGYYPYFLGLPAEERYWPEPVPPLLNPEGQAVELLKHSIEQGATILCIGPLTNLALLERRYPGSLAQARLFVMGGYVYPVREGFPAWENKDDFNLQVDARSARLVLERASPTLVPLSITVETALCRSDLPALRRAGTLGQLIARQAEAFAVDERIGERLVDTCPGLPRDIINFQHDALAAAIAMGYADGIEVHELPLLIGEEEGWLTETVYPGGKPMRLVTKVDGARFNRFWLDRVSGSSYDF